MIKMDNNNNSSSISQSNSDSLRQAMVQRNLNFDHICVIDYGLNNSNELGKDCVLLLCFCCCIVLYCIFFITINYLNDSLYFYFSVLCSLFFYCVLVAHLKVFHNTLDHWNQIRTLVYWLDTHCL